MQVRGDTSRIYALGGSFLFIINSQNIALYNIYIRLKIKPNSVWLSPA